MSKKNETTPTKQDGKTTASGAQTPGKTAKSKAVEVKVVRQPVAEDSVSYGKGETFTCTVDRAKALGPLVEIVEPEQK